MLNGRHHAAGLRACSRDQALPCCQRIMHPSSVWRRRHRPHLAAANASSPGESQRPQEFGLAPAAPKTPYGEMLQYYLRMQPELFQSAVEDQLRRLKEEKDAHEAAKAANGATTDAGPDKASLTLYKRMQEVRINEQRATLEDLMYVSILEKFIMLGVDMLPRMDGFVDVSPVNLKALTESIHSQEALELVKQHLLSIMGPATLSQFSNTALKMSKFQMAQMYAASIMFGYFLRRVDRRFQLEKAAGTLALSKEDAVARLERLFAQADAIDMSDEEASSSSGAQASSESDDLPPRPSPSSRGPEIGSAADWLGGPSREAMEASNLPSKKPKSALRKYVEGFDQATMAEMARIVSLEGAALVERQTSALLGDIKKLTAQVQEAVGTDAQSMQEVMVRMARAVETDAIETLTMTVGTQRRAVLEAVAYGTFLRDVETWVDTSYAALLTPAPGVLMLPGSGNLGSDDDDDGDGGLPV